MTVLVMVRYMGMNNNESPASLPCAQSFSCRQGLGCARHPNLSAFYRRLQNAKSPKAKTDNEGSEGDAPEPADAGLPLQLPYSQDRIEFWRDVGGQGNTNLQADYRSTCPSVRDDRGEQNGMCPAVPPQVVESRASTPTLPNDESTGELKPADAEPRLQPQSPCGAASSRGVDLQRRPGSRRLSQRCGHPDENDQASGPKQRHLLVPDDTGEQDEDGSVAQSQAGEGWASIPRLSNDESNNDRWLDLFIALGGLFNDVDS
ncbi:hypothetical protein P885DRAFT_62817 [Corynascus similis CBS 632.67]